MEEDVRSCALYRQVQALHERMLLVGTGDLCDAAELSVSPDGRFAAFTGTLVAALEGTPQTRICLTELASGNTRILTQGPGNDRLPKFSPDGAMLAFLSEHSRAGDSQVRVLRLADGAVEAVPCATGWVEYFQWASDGRSFLVGVAGHGADTGSVQGAVTSRQQPAERPGWLPSVQQGDESYRWRRVWRYDLSERTWRPLSSQKDNVWEAVWCGPSAIVAVISSGPEEGQWYGARLYLVDAASGERRELYAPCDQLGCLAASPDATFVAIVESVCSDRGIVAGDLRLIHVRSGEVRRIDMLGMNVSHVEWRRERRLLLAGHDGFETMTAVYDLDSDAYVIRWRSDELTTGGYHAAIAGLDEHGDCALVGEGFVRAPEIAVIEHGRYRCIKSFAPPAADTAGTHVDAVQVTWTAPDGLRIQGWLLRPKATPGPYPTIMQAHGGPVLHWRPAWLGRWRSLLTLLLVQQGYAVFQPNPRGSSGRGQEFARLVLGDLGGADTHDYLSGLDHLVNAGIADGARVGVMGTSYGGYMTSWLITQDARFAAAVPVAPVTNRVSAYLLSNIPEFTASFLNDHYANPTGKFFERSPVMHASKVRTPTLNICGALDRCTPPTEAAQFHNALRRYGVRSALVTYPGEGHGIRTLPALLDYATRVVTWFGQHMPARQ